MPGRKPIADHKATGDPAESTRRIADIHRQAAFAVILLLHAFILVELTEGGAFRVLDGDWVEQIAILMAFSAFVSCLFALAGSSMFRNVILVSKGLVLVALQSVIHDRFCGTISYDSFALPLIVLTVVELGVFPSPRNPLPRRAVSCWQPLFPSSSCTARTRPCRRSPSPRLWDLPHVPFSRSSSSPASPGSCSGWKSMVPP